MSRPLVYADFQNADAQGRVRLNSIGTTEDLARLWVVLTDGLPLTLYTDDGDRADGLRVDGVVSRAGGEDCWVAVVDWAAVRPTDAKTEPRQSITP